MKISKGIPVNSLSLSMLKRNSHLTISGRSNYGITGSTLNSPSITLKRPIKRTIKKKDGLKNKFEMLWKSCNGPELIKEYKFIPDRKYRSDYYHKESKTIIELEGGIYCEKMGHSSVTGRIRDIEKYNEASFLKIKVIRLHAGNLNSKLIERVINMIL